VNAYLAGLSTAKLVRLCIKHTDPAVARAVYRLAQRRCRPTRQQVVRAAQLADVPVQSVSYWFGWGEDFDGRLVDLSRGGGVTCRPPATPEAAFGLLVWQYWIRPPIRICYHNKY
jgi:hypothetical protein